MTEPAGGRQPLERSRFTSRAAVLAVVMCAIALSLAYPVREYIAQRRQIDQLEAQRQEFVLKVRDLTAQQRQISSPAYIEQEARDKLGMCLPAETCYVIISGKPPGVRTASAHARAIVIPWYQRLWTSVQQADRVPGH
jgi:cell division protein FtsB